MNICVVLNKKRAVQKNYRKLYISQEKEITLIIKKIKHKHNETTTTTTKKRRERKGEGESI